MTVLTLTDCSGLPRLGLKGGGAAAWLRDAGVPTPNLPNQWLPLGDGLVARLGQSEYMIETDAGTHARLSALPRRERVYPVLHQSLCLQLAGTAVDALMRQVCSVHFTALDRGARPLVLTSMAGVSVVVQPAFDARGGTVRLWADATFGRYLWHTLAALCRELGGQCGAPPALAG
jgi:sarcosine oxidase subunit gamma